MNEKKFKVKNLIIGDIVKIDYKEVSLYDYSPCWFDDVDNVPKHIRESVLYRIGNYAFDLIEFKGYRIIKEQKNYPDNLRGKKMVIYKKPFVDIDDREAITRKEAILMHCLGPYSRKN